MTTTTAAAGKGEQREGGGQLEMIAAVGNINIMEASQRTGTWLLLHAHGIITKPPTATIANKS